MSIFGVGATNIVVLIFSLGTGTIKRIVTYIKSLDVDKIYILLFIIIGSYLYGTIIHEFGRVVEFLLKKNKYDTYLNECSVVEKKCIFHSL